MIRYSPGRLNVTSTSSVSRGAIMISRRFGPTTSISIAAMAMASLVTSAALADGPEYTYIGVSYEWTDVKYAVNPKSEDRYNNGTIEGENIDFSLGVLSWLHVQGQAFGYLNGTCVGCNSDSSGGQFDADMQGYKIGVGTNLGLDLIGLSENVDFVLRGNYIDTELSKLNAGSASTISDSGWSVETLIRGQISDRAEVHVGFEYQELNDVSNRDLTIGLNYRVFDKLAIMGRAIVLDSETGMELGLRWYFGDRIFAGRDSIVR